MADRSNEKKPDLSELFDINRHKAVGGFVGRFEELMRNREANADDFRALRAEAKDKMFSPVEIAAMTDIARWRTNGRTNSAAEKLAALRRVSSAIKLDLFAWADQHREGDAP